jgi:HK97 gp10 family phage protein
MAAPTVRVEGLAELDAALLELGKATGRNVLRRVAKARLQPIAASMKAKAPDDPETGGNDLRSSIIVSEKLSRRQAGLAGGGARRQADGSFRSDAKSGITMYAGPGPLPQAHMQEFGTVNHGAQPYVRPAWDGAKGGLLTGLAKDLKVEIDKAVARKAKRAARR